jgi:type I site-specific restriction endonuclease
MFNGLDVSVLNDPQFKEDSVRELVIAPILIRLGYHPSGISQVIRSKTLAQSFIFVGRSKHPVKTIPDYTLLHNGKKILVIDAKSPRESVVGRENVQQAYSYAIHPEIRCGHFAICNGKSLAVFNVEEPDPILLLNFEEFELKWPLIEKFLAPVIFWSQHCVDLRQISALNFHVWGCYQKR